MSIFKTVNYFINIVIFFCFCGFSVLAYAVIQSNWQEKFKKDVLSAHNQLRIKHGVPKLQWDETLARFAEKHAHGCQFKHSHSSYGENLAMGYPSILIAIQEWYEEGKHYSYFFPRYQKGTGHFTQLIWKSSTKLGCGFAICPTKNNPTRKFWVCEYSPHGNVNSPIYFRKNVLKSRFN